MTDDESSLREQVLLAGRRGLLVRLQAKSGMRTALLDVLNTYIDGLDEEPGTEVFVLSTDPDDADVVWLYEVFTDDAAQDAHRAAPGFAQMLGSMSELLATPPGVLRLDPLRMSLQRDLLSDEIAF